MSSRRGTAAIEALVALTTWGVLGSAVVSALVAGARVARRERLAAERREMLRATAELLAAELRGSVGGGAGVAVTSPAEVTYRALRWTGATCGWPQPEAAGASVRLVRQSVLGARSPLALRDSVVAWLEGYPSDTADDRWARVPLASVAPGTCPDGREAYLLTLGTWDPTLPVLTLQPGSAVLGFQAAAFRGYRGTDGLYWLGQATATQGGWDVVQPVTGPFDAGGVRFALAEGGRAVDVALRAGGDSITMRVAFRSREGGP